MRQRDRRPVHAGDVIRVRRAAAAWSDAISSSSCGTSRAAPCTSVAGVDEQPGPREPRAQLRPDERLDPRPLDRHAEEEQPQQHGELVRVAEPPQVRRQLGRPREQLVGRREPFLDRPES